MPSYSEKYKVCSFKFAQYSHQKRENFMKFIDICWDVDWDFDNWNCLLVVLLFVFWHKYCKWIESQISTHHPK